MKSKFLRTLALTIACLIISACGSDTTPISPEQPQPIPSATATAVIVATPLPTNTPQPEPKTKADADVEFVSIRQTGDDVYTFQVTVRHPDTGWDDYADGWDVVLPDGRVVVANEGDVFSRLLAHPHETEQPFTRSQSNLSIPSSVETVTVRAHDLVDGFGGAEVLVDLAAASGPGFEIER